MELKAGFLKSGNLLKARDFFFQVTGKNYIMFIL